MGWQDAVAISVVFGAAVYLSSLGWKGLIGGRSSGCGSSCGKCSSGAEASGAGQPEQVVSIGLGRVGAGRQASALQDRDS
ncbi:hypothetical protein [Paludisphaera borealis]|uniref:FeoB-associated Cys-rich membrane protein n=1 Tax=Paludisphaera borealis TaxID=1387353 RepID=A0A1U7CKD7_9BACT|nr:hypothetical protein [Paludisphaera borealis]APW59368.1 hypothetical protein BSF38_00790 [Paludisphaera borealis]